MRKVKKLLSIFKCMNLDGPQINAFEMLNLFSFNQHILVPVIFAMFREQCCGSEYIEFGSGSGVMLSILKEFFLLMLKI